jgi:hypothetical protein
MRDSLSADKAVLYASVNFRTCAALTQGMLSLLLLLL